MEKKGFDNLANKEQGEQQRREEEQNQGEENNQERLRTPEVPSCEHHDQREKLGKEAEEQDGIIAAYCFVFI